MVVHISVGLNNKTNADLVKVLDVVIVVNNILNKDIVNVKVVITGENERKDIDVVEILDVNSVRVAMDKGTELLVVIVPF